MSKLLRTVGGPGRAPLFTLAMLAASSAVASGQSSTGRVVVRVTSDTLPVVGANVASGAASGATERYGFATFTLPTG
jgi:hypothetical protein